MQKPLLVTSPVNYSHTNRSQYQITVTSEVIHFNEPSLWVLSESRYVLYERHPIKYQFEAV